MTKKNEEILYYEQIKAPPHRTVELPGPLINAIHGLPEESGTLTPPNYLLHALIQIL